MKASSIRYFIFLILAFFCTEEKTDEEFFVYSPNGNSKISGRIAEKRFDFTSFDDVYNQALKELSEAENQDPEA